MSIICRCIVGVDSNMEQFKSENLIFCDDCDGATDSGVELDFNTNINSKICTKKQTIIINYDKLSFEQKAELVKEYNIEGGGEFDLSWYKHIQGFDFLDGHKPIGFCNVSLSVSNYPDKAKVFLTVDDVFLLNNYRGQGIGMVAAKVISNDIIFTVVNFLNQYNKDVKEVAFFFIANFLSEGGEMFCSVMIESAINQEYLTSALGSKVNIEMIYDIGD